MFTATSGILQVQILFLPACLLVLCFHDSLTSSFLEVMVVKLVETSQYPFFPCLCFNIPPTLTGICFPGQDHISQLPLQAFLTSGRHVWKWSRHGRLLKASFKDNPLSPSSLCLQVNVAAALNIVLNHEDKGHAMGQRNDDPEGASVPGDFVELPYRTARL